MRPSSRRLPSGEIAAKYLLICSVLKKSTALSSRLSNVSAFGNYPQLANITVHYRHKRARATKPHPMRVQVNNKAYIPPRHQRDKIFYNVVHLNRHAYKQNSALTKCLNIVSEYSIAL